VHRYNFVTCGLWPAVIFVLDGQSRWLDVS
jgi:hypothetical protein